MIVLCLRVWVKVQDFSQYVKVNDSMVPSVAMETAAQQLLAENPNTVFVSSFVFQCLKC